MDKDIKLTLGKVTIGLSREAIKTMKKADWLKMVVEGNKQHVDPAALEAKLSEVYDEVKGKKEKKETSA